MLFSVIKLIRKLPNNLTLCPFLPFSLVWSFVFIFGCPNYNNYINLFLVTNSLSWLRWGMHLRWFHFMCMHVSIIQSSCSTGVHEVFHPMFL
jgi:hypothetical protein